VWGEVLKVDRVGLDDNFFDLGGHSLLLVRVHERLRQLFPGEDLSVVELFEHPTVRSLATRLGGPVKTATAAPTVESPARRQEGGQRLARRREARARGSAGVGEDA
jgi:aryl carrier-like protein